MSSLNQANINLDTTVRVFDEFYDFGINVPSDQYDVVLSFFESVFTDSIAAKNFTIALFRVADQTNTPVLTLLADMQDQDQITVTNSLAYFLNGIRSPSTLLGVQAAVAPNVWAARNVLL